MDESQENLDELMQEFPPHQSEYLEISINAGFGGPSHLCRINPDGTLRIPEGLVRELHMSVTDELEWFLNKEERVLYVRVKEQTWEIPDWLQDDDNDD